MLYEYINNLILEGIVDIDSGKIVWKNPYE